MQTQYFKFKIRSKIINDIVFLVDKSVFLAEGSKAGHIKRTYQNGKEEEIPAQFYVWLFVTKQDRVFYVATYDDLEVLEELPHEKAENFYRSCTRHHNAFPIVGIQEA